VTFRSYKEILNIKSKNVTNREEHSFQRLVIDFEYYELNKLPIASTFYRTQKHELYKMGFFRSQSAKIAAITQPEVVFS